MRIRTTGYLAKQGIQNIGRNKMFSLASVATMSICIFLFSLFFAIVINFNYMIKSVEEGVTVTVFFEDGIADSKITEIGTEIEAIDAVSRIEYVSAEQAWEEWSEQYFSENPDLAEGFQEDNPLVDSAHYIVYVEDISIQKEVVSTMEGIDGVRKVNRSEITASTLSTFNTLVGYISIAIIGILLVVSIFLISNTVMIGISVRSEEIAIMKLVGATDFFTRAPFILEGIIIGVVGAAIPLVLMYFLYSSAINFIFKKFSLLAGILKFLPVDQVFSPLIPVALGLGLGIGFIGSTITVRKHLRV